MKRRSVTRALALAMSLIMLSGEAMPAFAAGSEGGDAQVVETAADEETAEEDEEEADAEESVSEDNTVSEDAAASENEAVSEDESVSENEAVSENETAEAEVSEDDAEGEEEKPEEEILEASPDSDFDWNGNVITKYKGASAEVVIPARAVEIAKNAFKGAAVTKVAFEDPKSVIKIGARAFEGCSKLSNFDLPSGVKSIGGYAFQGCTSLTEITLPDNVRFADGDGEFGRGAFKDCTSLRKVKNVTGGIVVDDNDVHPPFMGCSSLTEVEFASGTTKIPNEIFSKCPALKTVKIPSTVNIIEKYAFCDSPSLTSVIFESSTGVTKIGAKAFNNCTSLRDFEMPSSVKSIGGYAFQGCSSLTEITLSKDVRFADGDGEFGRGAFKDCTSLKKVKNVTGGIVVDDNDVHPPFMGCTSLTEVEFASGITKIPNEIFSKCPALRTVTIPSTVNIIDKYAFCESSSLTSVIFESSTGVTKIGAKAFNNCTSLKDFEMPSSVKSIGGYAFQGCSSLTEVTLPKDVKFAEGDGEFGRGAFKDCTSLRKVKNVTGGIVADDNNVHPPFIGCTALEEVEFAQGIKKIPAEIFSKCVSLRSVTIPNSVTTIDKFAFDGCSALREIHLPSKLKYVKESAFRDCVSITEVYYGGKSTQAKIKKNSDKNNDPLFAVEWIKENRSDEPTTGELTLDGVKVNSLKDAFKQMKDKDKDYVITLSSDLRGEKSLTIPKSAKSVTINGNGHMVEITGTKLTSNVPLTLNNIKFRAVSKKGAASKFTVNAKKDLTINTAIAFEAKSASVRSGAKLSLNCGLSADKVSSKDLSIGAAGVLTAVKGCSISVKNLISGANGASITLAEGFKPIKLGGGAEGIIKINGVKQPDGTQILKTSAKKLNEDTLKAVFDVSGIKTSTVSAHLYYYGSKACIFADAISYNGKTYGVWKTVVADMNAAQKEAKKNKTNATFTVTLKADVNLMGKFLLPKKGYDSITINGGGYSMTFTSDITLTGNTTFYSVRLNKVNKKNEQVKYKIKKGKYTLTMIDEAVPVPY